MFERSFFSRHVTRHMNPPSSKRQRVNATLNEYPTHYAIHFFVGTNRKLAAMERDTEAALIQREKESQADELTWDGTIVALLSYFHPTSACMSYVSSALRCHMGSHYRTVGATAPVYRHDKETGVFHLWIAICDDESTVYTSRHVQALITLMNGYGITVRKRLMPEELLNVIWMTQSLGMYMDALPSVTDTDKSALITIVRRFGASVGGDMG